tara:strand:- start:769 stop:924 length:156 start_codon:yes stop_codon:yes gene_type:complete
MSYNNIYINLLKCFNCYNLDYNIEDDIILDDDLPIIDENEIFLSNKIYSNF